MKKILIVLVILAIGAWYAYHEYNRRNKDLEHATADVTIDAGTLIRDFEKDTANANRQYVNKIIAVSGPVKKIDADGNPVVIFLGTSGDMSSVKCSMDSTHVTEYKKLKDGDQVVLKGKCTGGITDPLFGTDVTLNFCVVQNKK